MLPWLWLIRSADTMPCVAVALAGNICVYCPGGPDSDFEYSTQSYTGYEPTSMRAIRARYNPYVQVGLQMDTMDTMDTTSMLYSWIQQAVSAGARDISAVHMKPYCYSGCMGQLLFCFMLACHTLLSTAAFAATCC